MMCCYYPTTAVAIDDDADFLTILTQHLGISDCIPYSSPNKAIETLKFQKPFERIQSRIIKTATMPENSDSLPEDHTIFFNLRGLHEEIYNINRFHDVSVLIIDYSMAEINGLDLCEELKDHPSKKILLTGGIDKEKIAIDAFNKGIIHRFINKSDSNFPNKLKATISTLKDAFFLDLNSTLLPHTATVPRNIYQHPVYINFMRNTQEQFDAIEYYMLDLTGSSLMLNAQGESTWLIVKHESDMINDEALARDQEASQELIQGITQRTLMPFFFSEENYQQPASEWKQYFHPCQALPGMNNYYYSVFEGNNENYLRHNKIYGYNTYRRSLNLPL